MIQALVDDVSEVIASSSKCLSERQTLTTLLLWVHLWQCEGIQIV